MVTVSLGSKKKSFKSVKEAAKALNVPYMTLYFRLRFGKRGKELTKKPRTYTKH